MTEFQSVYESKEDFYIANEKKIVNIKGFKVISKYNTLIDNSNDKNYWINVTYYDLTKEDLLFSNEKERDTIFGRIRSLIIGAEE